MFCVQVRLGSERLVQIRDCQALVRRAMSSMTVAHFDAALKAAAAIPYRSAATDRCAELRTGVYDIEQAMAVFSASKLESSLARAVQMQMPDNGVLDRARKMLSGTWDRMVRSCMR